MNRKILIAGFGCLSVLAAAQASGSKDQAASTAKGKISSGQPAITDNKKTSSAQGQSGQTRVATGDVNGDGRVDVAVSASKPAGSQAVLNSSDAASEQVKAPRDLATGQASGKRQYAPVIIRKVSDDEGMAAREQQSPKATGKTAQDDWTTPAAAKTNAPAGSSSQPRVATGDVNGDGKADAAINNSHSNIKNSKDAATGQTTGKRQHGDIAITKEAGPAPKQ
jgi:hypothetical protein